MESKNNDLIEVLIADSAAFLKNVALQNIARNVYTINEVVGEIKSAAARQRLAVLPYEISFRVPSCESIHVVSEFAKKTGDFQTLSLVDLKLLALTYQLHKEHSGIDGLQTEPTNKVEVIDKRIQGCIPGFYTKSQSSENKTETLDACEDANLSKEVHELDGNLKKCSLVENDSQNEQVNNVEFGNIYDEKKTLRNDIGGQESIPEVINHVMMENNQNNINKFTNTTIVDAIDEIVCEKKDDLQKENNIHHNSKTDEVSSYDCYYNDEDDDGEGWITPDNIGQVKAEFGLTEAQSKPIGVRVGCLTTDFAMQNVLIKMGLHVISVDGMLIREARSYVLKCYSCFKVTSQMERIFCPKCGNRTLVKISVEVDADGVTRYHVPKRNRPFNIRGKKHPLPLPKGGRHNNNPLLFEDQLITQRRLPKPKDKVNILDEDYVVRSSPFAVNNTTSRAFNLGFHVRNPNRRNPNEARKKTRRKK
ncbi:RNA-binding protein NOB1-like [Xenia sp. Carnegie-2017]|uniref:RNA-binding protein NOB1-like n=1 Tax=Xenia sp. Carnegie-2017 TaxID=2897299 RepID=UPI001F03732B|nr:RNA-binding protein NOB1-like [Xenia sp. Carnegie-2017]